MQRIEYSNFLKLLSSTKFLLFATNTSSSSLVKRKLARQLGIIHFHMLIQLPCYERISNTDHSFINQRLNEGFHISHSGREDNE
jgi:hypothetical protein